MKLIAEVPFRKYRRCAVDHHRAEQRQPKHYHEHHFVDGQIAAPSQVRRAPRKLCLALPSRSRSILDFGF
jgi:hypothetical protein